jgi:hypothetical protein
MSISVTQAEIRRLSLSEYLIVPKHLIIKLKTWLTISEEELFYMKVDKNKDILDYYDNPFTSDIKGGIIQHIFYPDTESYNKLCKLEINFTKIKGCKEYFSDYDILLFDSEKPNNSFNGKVQGIIYNFNLKTFSPSCKFKFYKVS